MPSIAIKGYEADDLAYIMCRLDEIDNSVIVSKDSDWTYLLTPSNSHHITRRGGMSETKSYDEVNKYGAVSPYVYKSVYDSLAGSHNHLHPTVSDQTKITDQDVIRVVEGDKSMITNVDLFHRQLDSFHVENYPDYTEVRENIRSALKSGRVVDSLEFVLSSHKYLQGKIKAKYYDNSIYNILNFSLYQNKSQ